MFLPNELMVYSSNVNELRTKKKKGLFVVVGTINTNQKKRTLVLTDYPRLLCIKEEENGDPNHQVRLKVEILFRPLPEVGGGDEDQNRKRSKEEDGIWVFRKVVLENHRVFVVHTVRFFCFLFIFAFSARSGKVSKTFA